MNIQRKSSGTWLVALIAIVAVGAGCEAVGEQTESRSGGLLGRVGASLDQFKKGGKLDFEGAEAKVDEGAPTPDGGGEGGGGEPAPEGGGQPGDGGCYQACEHIVSCVVESCPALGLPSVEELRGVVSECAAACDGLIDPAALATVNGMTCGDIWFELTGDDPSLADACQNGYDDDYGYDDEDEWEDEGDWSDDDWSDDDWGDDDWDDDDWDDDDWDDDDWGDDDGSDDDCDESY